MAVSPDSSIEKKQLGWVMGDLCDCEIVDDECESEYGENSNSRSGTPNAVATLPQGLVLPSVAPSYGVVRVTKSENVHFGNKTFFNGPITIKQIVSKEHDNPGYEHTEDVASTKSDNSPQKSAVKKEDTQIKPIRLQLWLKLIFSAVCIIIVGGICAIVSVTLVYMNPDDSSSTSHEEDPTISDPLTVEVKYYNYEWLRLVLISVSLIIFTWCYLVLTKDKDTHGCDKPANTSVSVNRNANIQNSTGYNVEADPLLIAPTHLRIVSRTDWLAQPVEKPLDKIRLPVPWVIIQHTATESCYSQSECVLKVRLIQMFHVESRGWFDIGYNFLVAGDGSAYTGRGWEYQGAHTLGYNRYSMGIAFIGTFNNDPPPKKQLDACKKLIQQGVQLGKIAKDYKLFAHRQLASTLSPGDKLFNILKQWPHFVKNFTNIEELIPDY